MSDGFNDVAWKSPSVPDDDAATANTTAAPTVDTFAAPACTAPDATTGLDDTAADDDVADGGADEDAADATDDVVVDAADDAVVDATGDEVVDAERDTDVDADVAWPVDDTAEDEGDADVVKAEVVVVDGATDVVEGVTGGDDVVLLLVRDGVTEGVAARVAVAGLVAGVMVEALLAAAIPNGTLDRSADDAATGRPCAAAVLA